MLKNLSSVLIALLFLSACTSTIVPKTTKQLQVVSYSQLTSLSEDVYKACAAKLVTKPVCEDLAIHLRSAKTLIDDGVSPEQLSVIFDYIGSKL